MSPRTRTLTLIDAGQPLTVEAAVHGDAIRVSTDALQQALGWELKPQGLCRAGTCVLVRDRGALVHEDGIDLAALARLLDRPLAVEADEGVAVLGASATERPHRLGLVVRVPRGPAGLAGTVRGAR